MLQNNNSLQSSSKIPCSLLKQVTLPTKRQFQSPQIGLIKYNKCHLEFQKKHSCSQISPHNNTPNNVYSGLPTINTVVSTSNLSTASFSFSQQIIRRIARQQVILLNEQITKNNYKMNLQAVKKSVKRSLEQSSSNLQKQTSDKLQIILGGIKKAMVQIQKQIKIQVLNQVVSLPAYENKRFKEMNDKVNKISQHVFKVPYERQKSSEIANQMKQITKQIEVFSQCNMTLFNQLNKIKSTVTSLSVSKPFRPSSTQSHSSINTLRPRSANSNLQFKNKSKSKTSFKQNQLKFQIKQPGKASPTISFSHIPSVVNLSYSENQSKIKDEMNDNSLTYQVDSQRRLLDNRGNYLLNEQGQFLIVEQEHIKQLRKFNMLME